MHHRAAARAAAVSQSCCCCSLALRRVAAAVLFCSSTTTTGRSSRTMEGMLARPRRNRRAPVIREAHTETWLAPCHFVYPLFIHAGEEDVALSSMPTRHRFSLAGLMKEVAGAIADGIGMIEVFPAIADELKTESAEEAWNPAGLVPTAISMLKAEWPELVVVTDVALDPYSCDGHDGFVSQVRVCATPPERHLWCSVGRFGLYAVLHCHGLPKTPKIYILKNRTA
eukprot:SAG31_NODE_2342_length_5912_cov_1.363152_12_plen_226_part_00